jgi:hypothetical protein
MLVSSSAFYGWSKTPENTDKTKPKEALEAKACEFFEAHKKVMVHVVYRMP